MTLSIAILSDPTSWMAPHVDVLARECRELGHSVDIADAPRYEHVDIAFFLSFSRLVSPENLTRARSNVVVHGSALPEGRGWSPWSWQILEGRRRFALSLFEAAEDVDSGPIYDQRWVELDGHELIDEWQARQAETTIAMCRDFVTQFPSILAKGQPQSGETSYYPRRRPQDSRIDPHLPIVEQFNQFRIADNDRYPVFFDHLGHSYTLTITKREQS